MEPLNEIGDKEEIYDASFCDSDDDSDSEIKDHGKLKMEEDSSIDNCQLANHASQHHIKSILKKTKSEPE